MEGISLCDKPPNGKVDAGPPALYAGDSPTAMATIDEDLNQIERDVRTLKIEYEQFFGGGRSRPPTDTQWRVDTLVRRYAERVARTEFEPAIPLQQSHADIREVSGFVAEETDAEGRRREFAPLRRGRESNRSAAGARRRARAETG